MTHAMRSALVTVGVVTMAFAIAPVAHGAALDRSAASLELSAQQNKDKKGGGAPKVRSNANFNANKNLNVNKNVGVQKNIRVQKNLNAQKNIRVQKNLNVQKNNRVQKNLNVQKNIKVQKNLNVQKNVGVRKNIEVQKKVVGQKNVRKFTQNAKSRVIVTQKFRGFPKNGEGHARIGGHNYSVWRGEHRVRYGGGWRTFVALSALGALAIGAYEFYPYAYVDAPQDYCDGMTEDGCQLVWQDVETEEGDVVPQCVTYCPWQ